MSISEMAMRCGWSSCSPLVLGHDADERLQHRVHRRTRRQRAGLPEAGDGIVDDSRIFRADRVVAEAVALDGAGPEPFDEHVGAVDQAPQDLLAFRASSDRPPGCACPACRTARTREWSS